MDYLVSRRHDAAVEQAWRIHEAQADWTGKVDAKATFSFGVQSAAIVAVVTLAAGGKLFDKFAGWLVVLFIVGVLALMLGATLSAVVVAPLLRASRLREEAKDNYIYFGHARFWKDRPDELTKRLLIDDPLPQLARQIAVMADVAWTKHLLVRWSIWIGVVGGFILVVCAYLNWHTTR